MSVFFRVLLIVVLGSGCSANEYKCLRPQECVAKEGGFGMCIDGHCAALDSTCPLDWPWRFDEAAGAVANQCATAPAADAAVLLDAMQRPDAEADASDAASDAAVP